MNRFRSETRVNEAASRLIWPSSSLLLQIRREIYLFMMNICWDRTDPSILRSNVSRSRRKRSWIPAEHLEPTHEHKECEQPTVRLSPCCCVCVRSRQTAAGAPGGLFWTNQIQISRLKQSENGAFPEC